MTLCTTSPRSALRPIADVAADLELGPDLVTTHGPWRAKISLDALAAPAASRSGRYVLVTAVTPTGAGEGKTVSSISLAMGLARRGHRSVATLRQSSLGPTFGMKGGGGGGGAARVEPLETCLLDLGLDLAAVEAANNLLAAAIEDELRRHPRRLDPFSVAWRRVIDVNDRALRHVTVGQGGRANGHPRETGFDITAASEVMAVLAISRDLGDLRRRLGRTVVGFDHHGAAVTADDLRAAGAMAVLLREAIQPNLMQTSDGTPVILHGGPFANIAFGNSSVVADRIVIPRADYVVTEAGFGADLGAEKFLHLKCAASGLAPSAAVVVTTVRATRHHGGGDDQAAVERGVSNLKRHVAMLRRFGLPVVVAINRFPDDDPAALDAITRAAADAGARATASHEGFAAGGAGAEELADAVVDACEHGAAPESVTPLYTESQSIEEKLATLASAVYGAADVHWSATARRSLQRIEEAGYGGLPICVAKTHLSLSHDRTLLGSPEGFTLPVRDVRLYAGAGYVTVLAGDIMTMPGLPSAPRFADVDLDEEGRVTGLA